MKLAFGIVLLWLGGALLWVAFKPGPNVPQHPWDVFKGVTDALKAA